MGTGRYILAGAGIQTAGLGFGGYAGAIKDETEEYNGSAWSEQNDLNTGRYALGGMGTQTAALAFGGQTNTNLNNSEEYNGTSWTEGNI